MTNCTTRRGSVVVEVVIATVIFSAVIVAVVPAMENQFQTLQKLGLYSTMLFRAQAVLEKTIAYNSAQQEMAAGIYSQSSIIALQPCLNEAVVTATATTSTNSVHSFTLSALFTPASARAALGTDCGGYMAPLKLAPPFSFSTTGVFSSLTSLDFFAGNAYLGASSTDGYNILVTNVTDHTTSHVALPPVNMLDAAGGYVYVATTGTTSQLQIIDAQNPNQPQIIATRSLPGVAGSAPSGLSVRYYAGRVYIGTHRTAGNEFHIFDVTTPSNPRWLGSLELNHNINDIAVSENYAYLATSGNTSDIIIINIADPAHPARIADITFAGTEDTKKLFLLGNTLYAGRLKGISASHAELVAINVASSSAPFIIATSSLAANVTGLFATAGHLLAASSAGIFSLTTSTSTPFFGLPQKIWPQAALGLDSENDTLYTIAATSSTLISFTHQ